MTILFTLDEASSLLNYDGWGYLCKEIDGKMYKASSHQIWIMYYQKFIKTILSTYLLVQ